jgi:hypothetical protein
MAAPFWRARQLCPTIFPSRCQSEFAIGRVQQLALSLNAVVSGVTATQVHSGIYLVDVLVRASAEQRMSLWTIRTLQVPLPNGRTVPLSQIASVDYGQEYPIVCVPSSSAPIRREYPATSAARIAVRRRVAVIVDPASNFRAEITQNHPFLTLLQGPFAAARCFATNW